MAAILPSSRPEGNGTLKVSYSGRTSAARPIRVVPSAFGIFTRNQAGMGPAIVQNYVSPTEAPVNALNAAARPGQVEILCGTGLGPIKGNDAAVPLVGNLDVDVEVLVGGRQAKVLYKGRSAEFPGLDQIDSASRTCALALQPGYRIRLMRSAFGWRRAEAEPTLLICVYSAIATASTSKQGVAGSGPR